MRHFTPAGYFCEALPSGEFAALVPGGVQTHLGFIPADDGARPLYVRITNVGGFQMAGQLEIGHGTLIWRGSWQRSPIIPTGSSGCIFDRNGVLHTIEPGPGVTSQGYRYVAPDGRLVTGDETYGPLHELSEWTDLSDAQDRSLLIGQGNPGGGIRVWDGQLRLLEPGPCRFIRANRDGEDVAIAAWVEGSGSVLHWLTVADLHALPVITQDPVPVPHDPVPEPEPMPELPDQTPVVATVRANYPTPLGETHGACLIAIAQAIGHGAGLLLKDTGTHIVLPNGVKVSQDIICFPDGSIYDCLSDAEGAASPSWGRASGGPFPERYYQVSGGDDGDPPDRELVKRVEALEKRLERLETAGLLVAQVYRP